MQLVHILTPSVLLALDDELNLIGFWRAKRNVKPHSAVTRVFDLYSTPNGKARFVDGGFETDALGCFRLLWAVMAEYPLSSNQAIRKHFSALFSDNPDDALRATHRVYSGMDHMVAGEPAYFSAIQWEHHPAEMAAIKSLGEFVRSNNPPH